jgi:hypothetical protein
LIIARPRLSVVTTAFGASFLRSGSSGANAE